LREERDAKIKAIEELQLKLEQQADNPTEIDKYKLQLEESRRIILHLKTDAAAKDTDLANSNKLILQLKDDFSHAYEKGHRANKAVKHEYEMNLKKAESNVKTIEQQLKRVNEEKEQLIIDLRKSERALLSAKKVALVERNFLDLVKVLADKRKEKKKDMLMKS